MTDLLDPLLRAQNGMFPSAPIDKMEQIMKDLHTWDPCCHQSFLGHEGAVWSTISTSDNRTIFSGSEDKNILVWDAITGLPSATLRGHTSTVNALELADSERLLISGAWDNSIKIWDWRSRTQVGSLDGHTGGSTASPSPRTRKHCCRGLGTTG